MVEVPGIKTAKTAVHRRILLTAEGQVHLPGGRVIDGSEARDPLNTGAVDVLQAGMLLGKIAATGLWAPAILGLTTVDYVDNDDHIHVSVATAVEIVRRVGTSGTLKITGAPTAGGTVVPYADLVFSDIDPTTGILTIGDQNKNIEEGAIVHPPEADGSYIPRAILGEEWGVKVTDENGVSVDVQAAKLIIGGVVDVAMILNYPAAANTTLVAWLQAALNTYGRFMFSDNY